VKKTFKTFPVHKLVLLKNIQEKTLKKITERGCNLLITNTRHTIKRKYSKPFETSKNNKK
jgi:hypothetical protein